MDGRKLHSNNIAEWCGLIAGLAWLKTEWPYKIDRLLIRGDSKLVIEQLNRRWRCHKRWLADLRDDARRCEAVAE